MVCEVFTTKCSNLKIELDHEGTVQALDNTSLGVNPGNCNGAYPENPENNEEDNFEEVPISIVGHLEKHKLSCAERIYGLEKYGWGSLARSMAFVQLM